MINTEKENARKYKQDILRRFGEHITGLRIEKELTSIEVAHLSGFEPSNMARIEKGRANLTLISLIRLAKALDLTLEEMVQGFDIL